MPESHSHAKSLNSDLNCGPPFKMITLGMPLNIPFSSQITVPVLKLWSLQMIENLLK